MIAYNEVAGSFSGVVYGISNTVANIAGIVVPYLISAITVDVSYIPSGFQSKTFELIRLLSYPKPKKTQAQWRIVFFITAGVYLIGGVTILVFGSSTLEPWAITYQNLKQDEASEDQI